MALHSEATDQQFRDVRSTTATPPVSDRTIPLEDELHEGDGRIPGWLWLVAASVALFAALAAPFQLFG